MGGEERHPREPQVGSESYLGFPKCPPLPCINKGEGKREEEGRKGEAESLPFLSLFSSFLPPYFGLHGVHQPPWGRPEPLPVTRYVPGTPRTLPVSEYHRPVYESLPLDHFEMPRHVRNLIRDSEQHSVTKSHN